MIINSIKVVREGNTVSGSTWHDHPFFMSEFMQKWKGEA
jgi:putative intracellular protease/amidase